VRTEGGKDGFILNLNRGQWSIDPEAGRLKDSVATPNLPTTRPQQQPEVVQQLTSERGALPPRGAFVVPNKTRDSIASSGQPTFGTTVGTTVGTAVGTTVATTFGTPAGTAFGTPAETTFGASAGTTFGASAGTILGTAVGTSAEATAPTEKPLSL